MNRYKLNDIVVVESDRFPRTHPSSKIGRIGIIMEINKSNSFPLYTVHFHDSILLPRTRLYYGAENIRLASQREIREELNRILIGADAS